MNFSLLGAILAKFQFWWFSGLFWLFFPCTLVKIDFFEIYFQSWRIKLRVLNFFRPILIIKRHQKNAQAKLFEKFASWQHALAGRVKEEAGWQLGAVNQVEDFYVSPLLVTTCFFATWLSSSMLHNRPFSTNITTAIIDQLSHLHSNWAIEMLGLNEKSEKLGYILFARVTTEYLVTQTKQQECIASDALIR